MTQDFGKYQLIKKLATGGMAEVWLARQTGIEGFNRLLVVKRILPHLADDPEFVQMFLNEAKIAARFNHPNIAQIFDLGETNGTYFIAMEFIHGEDLGRLMRKAWNSGQWIARPLAIRIIASACQGLYYAHTKAEEGGKALKVVHRDVSPQNILISFDGGVKVVDFGIAKAADQASMTKSGAIKGKFAYMSPEQAAGKTLDQRADLFSLGLVLYELLTGVRPLKRESELGTLQAALECAIEPPSVVADVPPELDGVVMRALAKAADDRYRDAREFQMALEELLVRQRWVATSVQISELMAALFSDRLQEEAKLGRPDPAPHDQHSGSGVPDPVTEGEQVESPAAAAPSSSADMQWDAPPGEPGFVERRKKARSPRSAPRPPAPVSESLPRPAGEEPPRRNSIPETRVRERTPLRAPTGSLPLALKGDSLQPLSSALSPPRERPVAPSSSIAAVAEAPLRREALEPVAPSEVNAPSLKRAEPKASPKPSPKPLEFDHYVDPGAKREWVRRLGVAGAVAAVLGVGFLFRAQLWNALNHSAIDGQGIYLTVHVSPHVKVYVRHPPGESTEAITYLGETPLEAVRGAHVRDTLILKNPEVGLYYEEELKFGEPNKVRKVEKVFSKGRALITLLPHGQTGLSFWAAGQEVGKYSPGLKLELFEGPQTLEVRGMQLKEPLPFDIVIKPNSTVEKTVDLSGELSPPG